MKNSIVNIDCLENKKVLLSILQIGKNHFDRLNWKLLYLKGTYLNEHTMNLEKTVRQSVYGIETSIEDVREMLSNVDDLWDILLIGTLEKAIQVKSCDEDKILFNSSDVVIEYFDSSYWTVSSINTDFMRQINEELGKTHKIVPVTID